MRRLTAATLGLRCLSRARVRLANQIAPELIGQVDLQVPSSMLILVAGQATIAGHACRAWLDTASFLACAIPGGELFPPESIQSEWLGQAVAEYFTVQEVSLAALPQARVRFSPESVGSDPSGEVRLRLATSAGTLFTDSAAFLDHAEQARHRLRHLADLTFRMRIVLGHCAVPAATFTRIEAGDVLRLPPGAGYIAVGAARLISCIFNKDAIELMDQFDDAMDATGHVPAHVEEAVAAAPGAADLSELAVETQFVLCERSVSLARLAALAPGQVLEIDQETLHGISVRAGGRTVAVGELVQIEDGLGVEIRQVYLARTG